MNLARVSNRKESSIIKSIICENLLVTPSADAKPERQDFVIAIDQSSAIYFLRGRDGTHFKTVETNGEEMNCACSARGMDEDSLVSKTQIVIGSSNGNLSYIDDFKVRCLLHLVNTLKKEVSNFRSSHWLMLDFPFKYSRYLDLPTRPMNQIIFSVEAILRL